MQPFILRRYHFIEFQPRSALFSLELMVLRILQPRDPLSPEVACVLTCPPTQRQINEAI